MTVALLSDPVLTRASSSLLVKAKDYAMSNALSSLTQTCSEKYPCKCNTLRYRVSRHALEAVNDR